MIRGGKYNGPDDLLDAAEVSELLGEELIRRAEFMLKLGQRLVVQAQDMTGVAGDLRTADGAGEERVVGKAGAVTIADAAHAACGLGTFNRKEFAGALGINPAAASKLLARLVNNSPHPIVERLEEGGYSYIIPPSDKTPTSRPEHAPAVDRAAGVGADSMATGVPVAHTRAIGGSGKPGLDKKRAGQGIRVKRGRVGT